MTGSAHRGDYGESLADQVAARVLESFPTATANLRRVHHSTCAEFIQSPERVRVFLTVDGGGEYLIQADPDLSIEAETASGDLDSQVEELYSQVIEIVRAGVVKVRRWAFLGPLSPSFVGSPGVDPIIDEMLTRRHSIVVARAQGWDG